MEHDEKSSWEPLFPVKFLIGRKILLLWPVPRKPISGWGRGCGPGRTAGVNRGSTTRLRVFGHLLRLAPAAEEEPGRLVSERRRLRVEQFFVMGRAPSLPDALLRKRAADPVAG